MTYESVLTKVYRQDQGGRDVDELDVDELDGVDGGDGEGRRLLVGVVELVKVFVQEGEVVHAMHPVRHVILRLERRSYYISA